MPDSLRHLSPWFLPFLLSAALLVVLLVGLDWHYDFQRQQARAIWEQEAREALAALRTTHTLESQIDGMGFAMAKLLSRQVARHPERPLTGRAVLAAWRRCFPRSHQIPGSRLYAFACSPDGRARTLAAQGLAARGGRVMADLFNGFARFSSQGRLPSSLAPRAGRLTKGVFGADAEPGILAVHRRGRTSPVTIDGRRGRLFWEIIGPPSHPAGGFFLLLPDVPHRAHLSLAWCLERVAAQSRDRLLPVLLPAARFRERLSPLYPRRRAAPQAAGAGRGARGQTWLLARLDRDRPDLTAEKTWELAGRWVMKGFFSNDHPYTAWVCTSIETLVPSPVPGQRRLLWAFLAGWLAAAAHLLTRPARFVSLRTSFRVVFFLVGAFPVAGLLVLGWIHLDAEAERDIQRVGRETREWIGDLDSKSGRVIPNLAGLSQRAVSQPDFLRRMEGSGPASLRAAGESLLAFWARHGLPAVTLFLFRPGEPALALPERDPFGEPNQSRLDTIAPLVHMAHHANHPPGGPVPAPLLEKSQEWWVEVYTSLGADDSRNLLFDFEETGDFAQMEGGTRAFTISHQFTRHGEVRGYLMVQALVDEAFRAFLGRRLARASLEPGRACFLGRVEAGGQTPVFPSPAAGAWQTPTGAAMQGLLSATARVRAGRLVRTADALLVTGLCARFVPFVVGVRVDLAPILARAWWGKLGLAAFGCLVLGLVTALGHLTGRFLIDPLMLVERGLQRVGGGDLTVRVGLDREDGLGDLTRAVDRMVVGLQERRNLGRFVSGTLEMALQDGQAGVFDAPRLVPGAILVSDIRGFTTLSEREPPLEVVAMLNAHLEVMSDLIEGHGGRIDKFIGDAIVAFFPAASQEEAARLATRAGLAMRAAHRRLQDERRQAGRFPYEIGAGVASGDCLVGMMRGQDRAEFTVLGPERAEAERLEGLSKLGSYTRVVVSPGVCRDLGGEFRWAAIPNQQAWELVGPALPGAGGGGA
ncbi:MAG: adenylate/guanylate cyclase domain-containing protein [Candidatus Riflebacteria bacterium]|nr:adenylate/guanylate cyclase domain-containing protein [Candidatus Riflebacteria bacterium]